MNASKPNTHDILEILLQENEIHPYSMRKERRFYYTRYNSEIRVFDGSNKNLMPPPCLRMSARHQDYVYIRASNRNIISRYIGRYKYNLHDPNSIIKLEAILARFKEICDRINANIKQ